MKNTVVLIILDGFGLSQKKEGNAVALAHTPNFDQLWNNYPHTTLISHGESVGLPDGQMGNSEVGHTNIGAGRIVYQDLTRINKAIREGDFFTNQEILNSMKLVKKQNKNLHLYGLVSDGGVHAHMNHLFSLLELAKNEGLTNVFIHAILDGRDTLRDSAVNYLSKLQNKINKLGIGQIATIQGRYYAMDRDYRWDRVEKSYNAMVNGQGIFAFDPITFLEMSYNNGQYDEHILPTVIVDKSNEPIAKVNDGDSIIMFNYRPDRAIEISSAFANKNFTGFNRGTNHPNVNFLCFTKYSEKVNGKIAFPKVSMNNTLGELVSTNGLTQLRIAETEKYPHVTFFFSGGREEEFEGETRILINSPKDVPTYDLKPEMSAYQVKDAFITHLNKEKPDFVALNFANPDMVGHTGNLEATIKAVEAVDECLGEVVKAVEMSGGTCVIIADHGNADEMFTDKGEVCTTHTLNPVPFIVTDTSFSLCENGILADVAPTIVELLNLIKPTEMTGESLINKKR